MNATAIPRPNLSGCNVSPVDGRSRKAEAAGSNPVTQTIRQQRPNVGRGVIGSTTDFDSVSSGSIPDAPANVFRLESLLGY